MIDMVKFYPLDKERFDIQIEESGKVVLKSPFNRETGEIQEFPKIGKSENLEIRLTDKASFVRGSLHKYHNMAFYGEEHNYNDFSFCECCNAIEMICNKLNVMPNETKVTNLEFGLNIHLPNNPKLIIEDNILMYDFADHTVHEKYRGRGDYKEFKKYDYSLKVYNKSKQYRVNGNILRIEVKIMSKRKLHQLGIFSLDDLTYKKAQFALFRFLLEHFDKLMVVDSGMMQNTLKKSKNDPINEYCNPHFWKVLKQSVSDKVYRRHTREFHHYLAKNDISKTKNQMRELLKSKFYSLMNCLPSNNYQKVA